MGSFHVAEIYELVGLHLLDHIKVTIDPKHIALYHEYGLAVVNNDSNADLEGVCKNLRRSIKDIGSSITIEPDFKKSNFLDILLYLTKDI